MARGSSRYARMKQQITLEGKDVRRIVSKFLDVPEEQVIPLRYNFAVEGLSIEEIERKLNQD